MNVGRMLARGSLSLVVCLLASGALGATRTWTGGSTTDQLWSNEDNWQDGVPAAADDAFFTNGGGAIIDAPAIVKTLQVTGASPATVTIGAGQTLSILNSGGPGLNAATADLTIDGDGTLIFSTAGSGNELDNGVNAGYTLTLNALISGAFGFEAWRTGADIPGGTIVMGNEANDFTAGFRANAGHTVVASKLANSSSPSSIGAGDIVRFANMATLRYTGGGDSMNRTIQFDGEGGRIEHKGQGLLTLAGQARNASGGAQTLELTGDSTHGGLVTGNIIDNSGTLAVVKNGSATWVLKGANTFSGGLAVNEGTLGLDSATAAGSVQKITMAPGATLAINTSATDGFAAALPPVVATGDTTITINNAPNTSTVSFKGLQAAGRLNVSATGAGTAFNRIFVAGMPSGLVGAWLTVNGNPATYDSTDGLREATHFPPPTELATKGNPLPNGEAIRAVINSVDYGADITLPADPTKLYSLTQEEANDSATVNNAGQTLVVSEVAIAAGAAALTIGATPQDGAIMPPMQEETALELPDESGIAALHPVIWYDPANPLYVIFGSGGTTVDSLINKGEGLTGGTPADLDAVVRSDFTAPLYATGAASHAAWPMLKLNATSQGLQSLGNCGIAGNAARTIIAVMSRETGRECLVSIGAASSGNAFEPYLRNDYTRFGTFAGDINTTAKPAETPVIMSFFNGVGGNLGTFQGAADGILTAEQNRGDLNTTATPLHLGYRNGAGSSEYRGQIGEVMLFDYTLTETQRETVEAYLRNKWLPADASAVLVLRNDSDATLTVNATVSEQAGNVITLAKSGTGDVTFAGGITISGTTQIGMGTLRVNTPENETDLLKGAVSGAGMLVKDGQGILTLPSTAANTYTGGTVVANGTLVIGHNQSLGTGRLTIEDGGTLDLGGNPTANMLALTTRVTVSGTGADGLGAIANTGQPQQTAFQNTTITLADDALFSSDARWDLRGTGATLDLAEQYGLTKTGASLLAFAGGHISNAPPSTASVAVDIQQGEFRVETSSKFLPSDALRTITFAAGTTLGMYSLETPFRWNIAPQAGMTIRSAGIDAATNKNVLTSDIILPGTLNLTSDGAFGKNLTGQLTGAGGLSVYNGGRLAVSLLSHPNNTFAGNVSVNNAILGLLHPGSLPASSQLTLNSGASSGVRIYPATGWTDTAVRDMAARPIFVNNNTLLQLEVGAGETHTLADVIGSAGSPMLGRIEKFGAGALTFNDDVLINAQVSIYAGSLLLTDGMTFNLGNNQGMYIADGIGADCAVVMTGSSKLLTSDMGYNGATPGISIAQHAGKATFDLKDSAEVHGEMFAGGMDPADTNAVGAIYLSGNSRWVNFGGNGNDSRIGRYGYGLVQVDGGELFIKGGTQFGTMKQASSVGILRQTNGSIIFNGGRVPSPAPGNGTPGDAYGGTLAMSRGGTGVFQFEGGKLLSYGALEMLDDYSDDGTAANDLNHGTAVMTVTGTANVTSDRETILANRMNAASVLNLNGGKLTTTYLNRPNKSNSKATVNFNGGTLCVTNNAGNTRLIAKDAAMPLTLNVYDGGATIEIGAGVERTLDVPLTRPAGQGIASISVSATGTGTGYIAPPYVSITGGGGSNATAFARINRATGALEGIDITSPGDGYTSAPTVTLTGGGGTGATLGVPTMRAAGSGGLTKTGAGTLVLAAANTYWGATRVEGGTLRLANPQALPENSEIIIDNGTFDLGGHTVTTPGVTILGAGGIINGKVITASAVKTGSGLATWGADIEFAAVAAREVPGLWEGNLKGNSTAYWNTTAVNPCESLQLTTRAGNGTIAHNSVYADGMWSSSYNTWVYTGHIWNRTGQDQKWTWRFTFDDYVYLKIDNTVIRNNTLGDAVKYEDFILTPGRHTIDIRFGDGTGNVGPASGLGGLTYDPAGGGSGSALANFILLQDKGDGQLLTVTLDGHAADPVIRVEQGTLRVTRDIEAVIDLTPGTTLDMGGDARGGVTVIGGGNIVNGGLGTGAILSPAGADKTGTFDLTGITALTNMTYLVTVREPYSDTHQNRPGLWEGNIKSNWDTTTPNPSNAVQLTTRAGNGNGPAGGNGTWAGGLWAGNSNTWVYTGYLWNRTDANQIWTWRFTFDDNVALWLDGQLVRSVGLSAGVVYHDTVIKPGPHAIEVRYGDGIGNVGPVTGITGGGLTYDPLGRGATNDTYYTVLESDDGQLLSITPDIGICDLLTSDVEIDLTGLVIKPSDEMSKEPLRSSYVIAYAEGGFTGKPTIDTSTATGFIGKKWNVLKKGNELLLTTQGGSILLLR